MKKFLEGWSALVATVVAGPGRLSTEWREAARRGGQELPEGLRAYVNKLRTRAYAVTDQDLQQLRSAGLDDEQIYELTVAAAIGAADERRAAFQRVWEES